MLEIQNGYICDKISQVYGEIGSQKSRRKNKGS